MPGCICERKAAGEHVNEKDYRKHKNDVFRLLQIINVDSKVEAHGLVKDSIDLFLNKILEEPVRVEQMGLSISFLEAIDTLRSIYF